MIASQMYRHFRELIDEMHNKHISNLTEILEDIFHENGYAHGTDQYIITHEDISYVAKLMYEENVRVQQR